jgi:hypothetical protein
MIVQISITSEIGSETPVPDLSIEVDNIETSHPIVYWIDVCSDPYPITVNIDLSLH